MCLTSNERKCPSGFKCPVMADPQVFCSSEPEQLCLYTDWASPLHLRFVFPLCHTLVSILQSTPVQMFSMTFPGYLPAGEVEEQLSFTAYLIMTGGKQKLNNKKSDGMNAKSGLSKAEMEKGQSV